MITQSKKRKLNPMLMNVIIISGLIHIVGGLVLGGLTIVKYVIPDDAQFEEPPAVVEEEPPAEVKVEYKPQPQQANQPMRNLSMKQVGNIAVANVDVAVPSMSDNFTVSAGLGGVGNGNLLGGAGGSLNLGMSDVSVFGLKTRAERILFVIDTNRQMVTDAKGGLNSYQVIKNEITDMVGNLSAGTLYNVMLQDRRRMLSFKPRLISATPESHKQLVEWLAKINTDADAPGLEKIKEAKTPKLEALANEEINAWLGRSGHRANETAFITQAVLEQNADAIFMITGYHRGFENILAPASEKQVREFEKRKSSREYQKQLAEHQKEVPQMQNRITATLNKINADRAKQGLPPRVLAQRHGIYSNAGELGLKWTTPHPGHGPGHQVVESREVIKYFKNLLQTVYLDKERPAPSVNVVLFLAGDEQFKPEWERTLKDYTRFFKGKYRVIRGEDEIKSARSSKETQNR